MSEAQGSNPSITFFDLMRKAARMLDVMWSLPAIPSSPATCPIPSWASTAAPGCLQPCACGRRRMAPWPAHQPSRADSLHELSVRGRGHSPAQEQGWALPSSPGTGLRPTRVWCGGKVGQDCQVGHV